MSSLPFEGQGSAEDVKPVLRRHFHPCQYVSLSTQCIGGGPQADIPIVARCTIVGYRGEVLYDYYVQPVAPVTNYFPESTGIVPLLLGPDRALPWERVREDVRQLICNKIVVGHQLHDALSVLEISHRAIDTRDVGMYLPPIFSFRSALGSQGPVPLRVLCAELMTRVIQSTGVHNPIEDARAAMDLFRTHEETWEAGIANGTWPCCLPPPSFSPYLL